MDKQLRVKIQALRMWIAHAPDRAMFHRGLAYTGQDADAIFAEIDNMRLAMSRQLSELESLDRLATSQTTTARIVPFPTKAR
jgi:hypothetical protein